MVWTQTCNPGDWKFPEKRWLHQWMSHISSSVFCPSLGTLKRPLTGISQAFRPCNYKMFVKIIHMKVSVAPIWPPGAVITETPDFLPQTKEKSACLQILRLGDWKKVSFWPHSKILLTTRFIVLSGQILYQFIQILLILKVSNSKF